MRNIRLLFEIVKEILYVLDKKRRWQALGVLCIIIINSAFELLGVTAVLPFVWAVLAPDEVMRNPYVRWFCELLGVHDANTVLVLMGIMLILVYLIKNIFSIFSSYIQSSYALSVQKELSTRMLRSYMDRPYTYFLDTNSSIVLRGCNTSVSAFYSVLENLFRLMAESLTILLIGGFLIYTDFFIAIGTLAVMGIVLLGIVIIFKPIIKGAGNKNKIDQAEKSKSAHQAIYGIKDILVMQRKEPFIKSYEEATERVRRSNKVYSVLNSCPDRITEGICVSGIIGIICIRLVIGSEDLDLFVPRLAAFAMAAFKVLPSVGRIANRINAIVYERPLQEEVYHNVIEVEEYARERECYVKRAQDKIEGTVYEALEKNSAISAEKMAKVDFLIKFQHVKWKYPNQKGDVLHGLSLYIKKGESIGLIGPSGSGKTTTADILLGLLQPQEGKITIDGKDIFAMPLTWSRMVGYVPQSVYLIDDTVRANVAFGLHDISDNEIWNVLERAQLKVFIESLPQGLDTIVGERGVKFSGGQRQRIAIARALCNDPQILIMDEATAALDNETENAVMESIETLQGKITLIIVAHRLTTIRKCDRIYEINRGVAIERSHKEVYG